MKIKVGELCPAKKHQKQIFTKTGSYSCLSCEYNNIPGLISNYVYCNFEKAYISNIQLENQALIESKKFNVD